MRRYDILDTPPDGAFDRVCALARRFFQVPIATVTIVDEDRIWFKAAEGLDAAETSRDPGLCASAILDDGAYVVTDGLSDPRTVENSLVHGDPGVRFYAAAPITTTDGYRLGTVNVIGTEPREVTEEEARTLEELAAIVMDELELRLSAIREIQSERERRDHVLVEKRRAETLANTLQQTLSPPMLPQVAGLEVVGHHQPFAREEVGGDFYDVFPLAEGRWGIFLGDVCGKGPEAAALTSLARYALRTAAMLEEDPAAALRDLNTVLLLDQPKELSMCTVAFGHIDRNTDRGFTVSLGVAGHPAPLVVRASGNVEKVMARGPVLGVLPDPAFEVRSVVLEPGDAVALYSDGILDLEHAGGALTEERIAGLLEGASGGSAGELVARLRGVLEGVERPLRDDVAILALSVCEPEL